MSVTCRQCAARTNKGERCKRKATCKLGCNKYCFAHAKNYTKGSSCTDYTKEERSTRRRNGQDYTSPRQEVKMGINDKRRKRRTAKPKEPYVYKAMTQKEKDELNGTIPAVGIERLNGYVYKPMSSHEYDEVVGSNAINQPKRGAKRQKTFANPKEHFAELLNRYKDFILREYKKQTKQYLPDEVIDKYIAKFQEDMRTQVQKLMAAGTLEPTAVWEYLINNLKRHVKEIKTQLKNGTKFTDIGIDIIF